MGSQLPDDLFNRSAPLVRPPQSHEYSPATLAPAQAQALGTLIWLALLGTALVALVGIALSALGLRALSRKGLATADLVLSILGLALAIGTPLVILAMDISEI